MAKDVIEKKLSIFINDRDVTNSLTGISREIARVSFTMRGLNKNSETYYEDLAKLKGQLVVAKEKQAEFREEIHGTTKELGAGRNAFANIFEGLKSGDFTQVKEGFSGIKGGVTETIESFKAFIGTPVGAAIAVLVGFGLAAKKLHEYNIEMNEFNTKLGALGIVAKDLPVVRSEVMATANTYKKSFDEIAEKAASLSVSFGISMSEANDVIARGLAMGGTQNEEFLDSLGEYDEFFAKAGYSAQNFVDILNEGPKLGIYTDKLPDAIKEANLAIEEQTITTRDALVNAFGAAFTDNILSKVKDGTLSTKDALAEIAKEASKVGLNAQQAAQLTADLFKGAGEDAGGALKVLQAVGQATKKELDSAAAASENLRAATEALNKTNAELFEIEGYGNMWTNIATFGVKAYNLLLKSIANSINSTAALAKHTANVFIGIYNQSINLVSKLAASISPVLNAVGVDVDKLEKKIESLKAKEFKITPIFNLDADKAVTTQIADAEAQRTAQIKLATENRIKVLTQQKERLEALGKDSYNVERQLLLEQQKQYKKGSDEYIKLANQLLKLRTDHNSKLATESSKREAQEEKDAKAGEDRLKKYLALQAMVAKANLDLYIAGHQSQIKEGTLLTQKLIDGEAARLEALKAEKLKSIEIEKSTNDIIIGLKRSQDIDLNAQDIEYLTAKQNLELENLKATDALKKEYAEQQKQLALEQAQIDYELKIANADSVEEEEKLRAEKAYKDEKARYTKLFNDKKISAKQYSQFVERLDKDQKAAEKQRELERVSQNLGALNTLAGSVGELFGQSKELALAQAGINGALAITSILAQYPKFDGGFAMYAAMAAAVISTTASVKKIQGQKAPKRAKFFEGGYTGNDALYNDQYGKVTQVNEYHANEWVMPAAMLKKPVYANVAGWLEAERKQAGSGGELPGTGRGSAAGGNAGSLAIDATAQLIDVVSQLNATLQGGIQATTHVGYEAIRKINKMNEEITASGANGTINKA